MKAIDLIAKRHALGLTQETLAERLGLSPRQVQRLESGDCNIKRSIELALAGMT